MTYSFYKYHGTGNDFILLADEHRQFDTNNEAVIRQWCSRRFGIGADGLIVLQQDDSVDFNMVYCNSDGKISSMCGNGGRCAVAFAKFLGWIADSTTFRAVDGLHEAIIHPNGLIRLQMNPVTEVTMDAGDYLMNTGSPHYVSFDAATREEDFLLFASNIRYSERFKQDGVNVNVVQEYKPGYLNIRTYERGVEAETYSCGTGAVAAAISAHCRKGGIGKAKYHLSTRGGSLTVGFTADEAGTFTGIYLEGPAVQVYQGQITDTDYTSQSFP